MDYADKEQRVLDAYASLGNGTAVSRALELPASTVRRIIRKTGAGKARENYRGKPLKVFQQEYPDFTGTREEFRSLDPNLLRALHRAGQIDEAIPEFRGYSPSRRKEIAIACFSSETIVAAAAALRVPVRTANKFWHDAVAEIIRYHSSKNVLTQAGEELGFPLPMVRQVWQDAGLSFVDYLIVKETKAGFGSSPDTARIFSSLENYMELKFTENVTGRVRLGDPLLYEDDASNLTFLVRELDLHLLSLKACWNYRKDVHTSERIADWSSQGACLITPAQVGISFEDKRFGTDIIEQADAIKYSLDPLSSSLLTGERKVLLGLSTTSLIEKLDKLFHKGQLPVSLELALYAGSTMMTLFYSPQRGIIFSSTDNELPPFPTLGSSADYSAWLLPNAD